MNSLFVRIYWGMLISVLVVASLAFVTLEHVNGQRYQTYRETHFASLMDIIRVKANNLTMAQRYTWIGELNRRLDGRLTLLSREQLSLPPRAIDELNNSGQYVAYESNVQHIAAYMHMPQDNLYIKITLGANAEDFIPAMASILFEYVQEQQVKNTAQFNVQSLTDAAFITYQKSIGELNQKRLDNNELVVTNSLDFSQKDRATTITVVQKIADNQALVFGPIALFDWYPPLLLSIIGTIGLLCLGCIGYFLVRPLENGMKQMESAIDRIRKGDLSARVYIDTNDAIGELASTINEMAEHIQRLIKSQREMTNAVSHELRTPVARIRFGLQIIQDFVDNPSVDSQVEKLDEDIVELEKLIDEILTYATLEEGRPALNLEAIDVNAIANEIKQQSLAQGHSIIIDVIEAPMINDQHLVECERRYIHRAIQNLVNNAVKYAASQVRVSCSCEGGMFRVDVEDDGPGIPQDQWQNVFTPFARLDSSRNRSSGGYGLGLSIVKSIAYWHGGVAAVYFGSLGGAKFTILWPRNQEIRNVGADID